MFKCVKIVNKFILSQISQSISENLNVRQILSSEQDTANAKGKMNIEKLIYKVFFVLREKKKSSETFVQLDGAWFGLGWN